MRTARLILIVGLVAVGAASSVWRHRSAAGADPRTVLDRYCVGCHNPAERAGGVVLDGPTLEALTANRDVFEHAPSSRGAQDYASLVDELETCGFLN